MKKSLLILGLISMTAACTMKEETINPAKGGKVLYATIEDPGTKVYLDEDLKVLWNADDRISVFEFDTYNQQYSFDGKDGDNNGTFSIVADGKLKTSNDISLRYAVYPYSASNSISNSEVLSVILPCEQTYADHSFGPGANTMVAATSTDKMKFKNVCGYLMIKLYGDHVNVKSITLRGNSGEKIAGAASVNISEGGDPTTTMASDATTEITLACPETVMIGTSSSDHTAFWFAIPPVEFTKGFTIVVEDRDGGSFTKTTDKSLAIARSHVEKMASLEVVMATSMVVDAEGGAFTLAGCDVEVPAGAVQEETEISIKKLEDAPEGSPEAEGVVAIYEFSPSGTTFQSPISVSFPMPDAADGTPVALLYLDPESNRWQACGESTVAGGTVTFQLSHFSTYALVSGSSPIIPNYLCFTSQQDGSTIGISNNGNSRPNVKYSFDGSVWNDWDYSNITLDNGEKVYLRGDNPNGFTSFELVNRLDDGLSNEVGPNLSTFTMSGMIAASGNVMSLLYPDDFERRDSLLADGCFGALFMGCSALTSAPELPATSLTASCYFGMFGYCSNLVSAPELPATSLAEDCYASMFYGCSRLKDAPELPAMDLAARCYGAMFSDCTELEIAPTLAATTLVMGCYHNLFYGCTNLNHIEMLATDITAYRCLDYWVDGVASTGTFVKNAAAGSDVDSVAPPGWEILSNIPNYLCFTSQQDGSTIALANDLINYGSNWPDVEFSTDGNSWTTWDYSKITLDNGDKLYLRGNNPNGFSLHPADDSDERPGNHFVMSGDLSASGNIMSLIYGADFEGRYDIPNSADFCFYFLFSDCSALVSVDGLSLPATTLSLGCYVGMFGGCSFTKAPELPATTLTTGCYASMFQDCIYLKDAPVLPATSLADACYNCMFISSSSLDYIKMLATDISANGCLGNWVDNVAPTGTFVMNPQATWDPKQYGLPANWTVIH